MHLPGDLAEFLLAQARSADFAHDRERFLAAAEHLAAMASDAVLAVVESPKIADVARKLNETAAILTAAVAEHSEESNDGD
ncbi:hypothetical protein SAMN06265338_1348 [Rhodoblastus acidophilus]|uniref:Uncharacterized protein n=1 Tax=Rhodoblastus acidophilus TaxID=1074 RepID=A0A212SF15_RHOAC|nr:hypothetical protein [Rhodoblastus acidophilus]PPQ37089.1 hypothetical protein CKO16_15985 [Rhodoblastus acidophilus]RAI16726.1 hypothetical protein CH337_19910 [Rhodoblastus acidophilus]SNB84228.1 hypothetical protein SAMN06265338_1348 [Rhodoblastus acidophilus]